MIDLNIQPTKDSFRYSLRAASNLGNVKMAYEILNQMQKLDFQTDHQHISFILDTYSVAMTSFFVPQSLSKLYLSDGWSVFNNALISDSKKLISDKVLNSLLRMQLTSLNIKEAEELVLPLFQSLSINYNAKTYEVWLYLLDLCLFYLILLLSVYLFFLYK